MPPRGPVTKAWTFNVILDTKARKIYPKALTLAEISCEIARVEHRDVEWLLGEAQREFGGNSGVRLAGLRRMKGNKDLDLKMELSKLENNEALVGVANKCIYIYFFRPFKTVALIAQAARLCWLRVYCF